MAHRLPITFMNDYYFSSILDDFENIVRICEEGHGPVLCDKDKDCPACKQISKRLAETNALEVKLALAEQKITMLEETIDSLNTKKISTYARA